MKITNISQERNPLLNRVEVKFEVQHGDIGGTPSRFEVRKTLASTIKTDINLIYLEKMETKTGTFTTVGNANIYDSKEQASLLEPAYIIKRNSSLEEPQGDTKENE